MADLPVGWQSECKKVFDILDSDHSGSIDIKELAMGLRAMGLNPTEGEVRELMNAADVNHDGKLSYDEFSRLFSECYSNSSTSREQVEQFFNSLDKDKSGTLDASELREALIGGPEPLTEEEINTIIQDFDKNHDGKINLQEFLDGIFAK